MNINITEDKNVEIYIKDKLMEEIEVFVDNIDEKLTTTEYRHLFIVNEQQNKLYKEKSKIFHSLVEKLLYVMKIVRPDLETAILFLCRRVSKRDVDDWKNLKRVLSWVK